MRTKVLIGSTIPAHAMQGDNWGWWCHNAAAINDANFNNNIVTQWCAVLQEDDRGREIFAPLVERLYEIDAHIMWFSLDLGDDEWTTMTRLTPICLGRNLIIDRGQREDVDYIYFADSDIEAADNVIPALLELKHPVTGAHIPTYTHLDGPRVRTDMDVREHWNSAGSLLVHHEVYRRVPWRIDLKAPLEACTDDPATQAEMNSLGYPTWVRHDVPMKHHPELINAFENRGLDRKVYR